MARFALVLWSCSLAALIPCVACSSDDSDSQGNSAGHGGSTVMSGTGGQAIGLGGGGATGGGDSAGTGGGSTSTGGSTGKGGSTNTGGSMSKGGTTSTGGSTTAGAAGEADGAGMMGTGASGTQPLGAICANDGNCSDAEGAAVCCQQTCTLPDACPTSTNYLPCESAADCAKFGGGKLCCEVQTSSDTMRFCTKQSGCSGKVLP